MPRFKLEHRPTGETYEIEATDVKVACAQLGWPLDDCRIWLLWQGPETDLTKPPVRITPGNRKRVDQR